MSLRPRVNKLIETLRTETPEMLEVKRRIAIKIKLKTKKKKKIRLLTLWQLFKKKQIIILLIQIIMVEKEMILKKIFGKQKKESENKRNLIKQNEKI